MLIMGGPVKSHELLARNWDAIDRDKYRDETAAVRQLLESLSLTSDARTVIMRRALLLVRGARLRARRQGVVESFLQEFSLSTPEGLALMGIAEALLRTPGAATKDRLIAERVSAADWRTHLGGSDSMFVNASTWALLLTSKWGDYGDLSDGAAILHRLVTRLGESVVRAAVGRAIWIMGHQFVLGDSIEAALARARKENLLCSFDMLGEGARTATDAERFEAAYAAAIRAVGASKGQGRGPRASHGISVKLSALSPRYETNQEERVWQELYPRLLRLATLAAQANINFTLDAEETDRLVISLKLLERLVGEPALGDWQGLGLAVQAYQRRCPEVLDQIIALAKSSGRRLMVRLVKGAYWDTEIKRAQVFGRTDYPVYTTKPATDVSYLACAQTLIAAAPHVYSQFATHNAHTLAAVHHMATAAGVKIEF